MCKLKKVKRGPYKINQVIIEYINVSYSLRLI